MSMIDLRSESNKYHTLEKNYRYTGQPYSKKTFRDYAREAKEALIVMSITAISAIGATLTIFAIFQVFSC